MAKRLPPSIILSLIILVFALPFVAAYLTYWHYSSNNFHTTNRGQLIIPSLNVNKITVDVAQKETTLAALTGDEIRHRWLLVYLAPSVCDADCTTMSFYLNQLQSALGKNSPHLTPLFVQPTGRKQAPNKRFPNVTYAAISSDMASKLIKQLPAPMQPTLVGGIYLVDPHGNLMMYYPAKDNQENILKDLQKLVKG